MNVLPTVGLGVARIASAATFTYTEVAALATLRRVGFRRHPSGVVVRFTAC